MYYSFVPKFSQIVRLFGIFLHLEAYISPSHFVSKGGQLGGGQLGGGQLGGEQSFGTFLFYVNILQLSFRFFFSLFSLFFPLFSRLPITPLEDDNSRDAWLSLLSLKRKEASLVVGHMQVVLLYFKLQVLCL